MILKVRLILDGEGPSKHNTLGDIKEKAIKFDYQKKKKPSTGKTSSSPEKPEKKFFNNNSNKQLMPLIYIKGAEKDGKLRKMGKGDEQVVTEAEPDANGKHNMK